MKQALFYSKCVAVFVAAMRACHSISMWMSLVPVSIISLLFLLNARFKISFPEVFALLKRQKLPLGIRLSALIHLLKEKHGYPISSCKIKTKIYASFN